MSKTKMVLLGVTAIMLVSGCNRGAANNSANKAATTNTVAAAPAPAAPAPAAAPTGAPVDAAFLTANPWAPAGACAQAMTFNADGTASSEGEDGTWSMTGNSLTMTKEGGQSQTLTASRSGNDLVLTKDGQSITASACPAGSGAEPAAEKAEGGQ